MLMVPQSAAWTQKIGPFVDATGAAMPSLTISQGDVLLSKNGGTLAQKNESSACAHDAGGKYTAVFNATDSNTVGRLQIYVNESGALPVAHEVMVMDATRYNSLIAASDRLEVDLIEVLASGTAGLTFLRLLNGIVPFVAATGTLTDRRFTTDLTGFTAGQLRKRLLVMLTGTRAGETSRVSDYVATNGDISLAIPLSGAPANGDVGLLLPW